MQISRSSDQSKIIENVLKEAVGKFTKRYYFKGVHFEAKKTITVENSFNLSVTDKNEKVVDIPAGEKIELISRHGKHRSYLDYVTIKWRGKELYVGDWNTATAFNGIIQNIPEKQY